MPTEPEEAQRKFERARQEAAERRQSLGQPEQAGSSTGESILKTFLSSQSPADAEQSGDQRATRRRTPRPLSDLLRREVRPGPDARDVIRSRAGRGAARRRTAQSWDASHIWIAVLALVVVTALVWIIGEVILELLPGDSVNHQIFIGVMLAAGGIWAHVILSAIYRE